MTITALPAADGRRRADPDRSCGRRKDRTDHACGTGASFVYGAALNGVLYPVGRTSEITIR